MLIFLSWICYLIFFGASPISFTFGLLNEYNRTCFTYESAYSFLIALTFYITKTQALNFLEFSFPGSFFFLKCVNSLESFLWQTLFVINPLLNFPFWYPSIRAAKNIKAWNCYPPLQQGRWHDMALKKEVKGSLSERLPFFLKRKPLLLSSCSLRRTQLGWCPCPGANTATKPCNKEEEE